MTSLDIDEFVVEYILDSIDQEMAEGKTKQPKVILFDIGGVCVSHVGAVNSCPAF